VSRSSPSRRTRAPAREPSATRPWTEAPTIPASTVDSSASRSGEVALLDEEPRSATVTADEELVCYVLDDARFRALTDERPSIASGC
jgi:hypothetical protein